MNKKELEEILINKVERIDSFEQNMDVVLKNLTVKINDVDAGWITLYGELYPKNGDKLESDLKLICVIYDNQGSIIIKEERVVYQEEFFGFEVFDFNIFEDEIAYEVGKIMIYPKK
jgi:hypothetical protein